MRRLIIGMAVVGFSFVVFADTVTMTVPQNVDATLDEAIAAGYMSGAADYAGLLAASDLVVNGAGRLIIDKDLKTGEFAGEVHVRAGSRLQLRVSGALGDTAHGTFVEDGATLETWTDGAADSLSFLGEPLSFEGSGVDGDGALVSLTTAAQQRKGAWGGTVLTMTGDALVHVKNARGNLNFPYLAANGKSSLDMNGHTLTFCGPYSSGSSTCILPLRLNITHPGHIVVSNGLYISINKDNSFGGTSDNTFTIADSVSRLDLYEATTKNAMPWSLVFKPGVRSDVLVSTSGGGRWDGPIIWQDTSGTAPLFAVKATASGGDVTFAGPVTTGIGMEVTNTSVSADYKPTLSFDGVGNRIDGKFKVANVESTFTEQNPSLGGIEIVNTKLEVNATNRLGIAGLWKGTNQAYVGWNGSGNTYLKTHWTNTSKIDTATDYVAYTNTVAYGPDDIMAVTAASYGKPTYVTYCGYVWNTNSSAQTITFFLNANVSLVYVGVRVKELTSGKWRGNRQYNGEAYKLAAVSLNPGPNPIEIRIALVNGTGAVNTTYSSDYGLMYCWGESTSTDAADYEPLMDPGDGSLFTRYAPETDAYEDLGLFGSEPIELANAIAGYAGATLVLNGGNYSVGSVTGALTVVNEEMPHMENVAFTVKDELCCWAADLMAGEHLVVTGALNFAQGSLLAIPEMRAMPSTVPYTIAEATGGITGLPTPVLIQQGRKIAVRVVDGTKLVADIIPPGFVLSFR